MVNRLLEGMDMKNLLMTLVGVGVAAVNIPVLGVISITGPGTATYSQNFDSLPNSGTTATWANNSTLSGWYLYNSVGAAVTTIGVNNGASSAGSFYSYGSTSERALGGLGSGGTYFGSPASGSVAGWIAVAFANNSGLNIDAVTVGFDGEQWRNGGNTTPQTMVFEYGFGSSFASVTTWFAPGGAFDWTSPIATGMAAAVDGNTMGFVGSRGGTIGSLTWADGETLWLRWIERNDAGNDHGLAIDNFSFSANLVPIPEVETYVAAALAGVFGAFWLNRAIWGRRRNSPPDAAS